MRNKLAKEEAASTVLTVIAIGIFFAIIGWAANL